MYLNSLLNSCLHKFTIVHACTSLAREKENQWLFSASDNAFLAGSDFLLSAEKCLQTVWTQIGTDRMSVLFWVQTI